MTTEEKLQHFNELCISDARKRYEKTVSEYKEALEKTFQEHKQDEERRAQMQIKIKTEEINKELNKALSLEQLKLKKMISDKRNEIDSKIFVELQNRLEDFMTTPKYHKLLDSQIKKAIAFAGNDRLDIYIDPNDADLIHKLSFDNNISLIKSKYSFMGGTRAVIPDKNILIDNSFEKKLADAKEAFHINIGGASHE
jgi:ATP synthase, subunit E